MPNIAPKKRVHVAVGVISDGANKILVSRRGEHLHQGGLWEFPGGKVEAEESARDALHRELSEELGIRVASCAPLLTIAHDYSDKSVLLDVWWVDGFHGEPHGREGQPLQWVAAIELRSLQFPAANLPIIVAIEQKLSATNTSAV